MNALMKKEQNMSVEERLAGLESDAKYLRKDVSELKENVKSLDANLQSFKVEVAKEFGAVHVAIESLKTSIEKSKIWMLVTGVGVITSTVITVARALKLF